LGWDDSVRKHLPYFKLSDPLADANVTIRDLLGHRAGLANNGDLLWMNISASREEIVRKIAMLPLSYSFRSTFHYNNIAFIAAGEIVGHVAGTTWEEFVNRRLLMPLGMANTNFSVSDALKSADHAIPHRRRGEDIEPIDWPKLDQIGAAGSINSSVRDLTRWMRLHLSDGKFGGKVILKEATIRETRNPQMAMPIPNPYDEGQDLAAYGLGWFIRDYRGHRLVYDPGGFDGWHSNVILLPEERYGIAILSNFGVEVPVAANITIPLRDAIMDELLGLPAKDPNPSVLARRRQGQEHIRRQIEQDDARRRKDTKPSLALAEYAGTYDHPAFGNVQVRESAGKLELEWHNWRGSLNHHDFDTFRVSAFGPFQGLLAQFRLTPNGNVRSILFLGEEYSRKQ
jgi:CubicO group peptidase (beta-lactamase class C family)